MKKLFLMIITAAAVVACQKEPAATAFIDENGDCIFQNSVVCFRINGPSNPVVTTGMEAILKAKQDKEVVVKDRKAAQAASMNDGGSALVVNDSLYYPHENFEQFEIVEQTKTLVKFTLQYPTWLAGEDSVKLIRTVTLRENSEYCEVADAYKGGELGEDILVAVGFAKRNVIKSEVGPDYIVAWESVPGGDGEMGVGFLMPMTDTFVFDGPDDQAVAYFKTKFNRNSDYAVGYCWSKGKISDFELWADKVRM